MIETSSNTTVLITGAARGIGKGLTETYLSRPNITVIAGVRDTKNASAKALQALPAGKGSKIILVKIDSSSDTDAQQAVDDLKSEHGIKHLDVLIANSGIFNFVGKAGKTPAKALREHFQVNSVAPLTLFQAALPLLEAATKPKFVVVSTGVASMAWMESLPLETTAYGSSKSAITYITRKIHFEYPHLISYPISPGFVQTDMGNMGAKSAGLEEAPNTLEESINGIVYSIDNANREETSGNFQSFDKQIVPW